MKKADEEWDALLAAVCDGRARDEQVARLDRILREDAEARDDYLYYVDTHACLEEECLTGEESDLPGLMAGQGGKPDRRGEWVALVVVGMLAAAALVMAMVAVFTPGRTVPALVDPFLAVVTHADAALWEGTDASVMIGAGVEAGPMELCEGRIEFELNSGVQVALEGPSRFDLISDSHGMLHFGKLAASVPPRGIGFHVETPDLSVVDLGTEFGLNVSPEGISELHVFEGEVEATTGLHSRRPHRERIGPNLTCRLDPESGLLEEVAFEASRFVRPPQVIDGVVSVWGAVRALRLPPESVREGTFQHNFILLFQEQAHVELEDHLEVSLAEPGRYRVGFAGEMGRQFRHALQTGMRVDSYFLHYDTEGSRPTRARGTVHFERPIVAVIAGGEQMGATDDLLGSWCTLYDRPSAQNRQLENDEVVISSDRRYLTLSWGVGPGADQIRVLVEAKEWSPLAGPAPR